MTFLLLALACAKAPLGPPPGAGQPIPLDGAAVKVDAVAEHAYMHYAVGASIDAPPAVVWAVLTDAPAYTRWNSTVTGLEGEIAQGETIKPNVKVAGKRTFKLEVAEAREAEHMVWQDGNGIFKGVRTFTLSGNAEGGTDWTMKEVFTGKMLDKIAPKLPDFAPDFAAFAADLAAESERRAATP